MHRSHWDLEVHAKDFQTRRLREAARTRLVEEAASGADMASPIARVLDRILLLWRAKIGAGPALASRQPISKLGPVAVADVVGPSHPPRARLAQPYADMVIVARGSMVGVTEQPRGVSDC